MKKKRIGLVVDFNKEDAVKLTNEARDWLKKKNCLAFVKSVFDLRPSILEDVDFIVTFGGDGTVLRTANAVAPYDIPMTRVNFGTVGYLCNIEPGEVFVAMRKILSDQYRTEFRTRIQAKIYKNRKEFTGGFDAFNEITVGSGAEKKTAWLQASIIDYDAGHERERSVKIAGDGLIIATRSGSTGYCLSAGGPALLKDAFAIVASNSWFESGFLPPHARSLVTPCDVRIEITVLRGGLNLPCVTADCDDERKQRLKEEERVIISKSEFKNLFIEF